MQKKLNFMMLSFYDDDLKMIVENDKSYNIIIGDEGG